MTPPASDAIEPGVETRALVDELALLLGGRAARHEARFIVDEALGAHAGADLNVRVPRPVVVPAGAAESARAMAARRAEGEPLQYIFGHWPFRELDLRVDPRVLIPRPETEQVVEVALAEARRLVALDSGRGLVGVDAGTGSGAIALALANALGAGVLAQVWATDRSAEALEVAAVNLRAWRAASAVGAPAGGGSAVGAPAGGGLPDVHLVQGSWLDPLPEALRGHVDLVVSNPPYVTEEEWAGLDRGVRAEPRQALVAGPGRDGAPGLADVEAVVEEASRWLSRPGVVVVELAPTQAEAARDRARQLGYDEVRVEADLAGRPRALVARRSG